ncbi:MAG: PEP-CTERM sorting domain-containing protein [Verrucomicrobiota bacterium]
MCDFRSFLLRVVTLSVISYALVPALQASTVSFVYIESTSQGSTFGVDQVQSDGAGLTNLLLPQDTDQLGDSNLEEIEYDPVADQYYLFGGNSVWTLNRKGSSSATQIYNLYDDKMLSFPGGRGFAVDGAAGFAFFSTRQNNGLDFANLSTVWSLSLDSRISTEIVPHTDLNYVWDVVIDPRNRQVYLSDILNAETNSTQLQGRILRMNYDGSGLTTVISSTTNSGEIFTPYGLAIDPVTNTLYWGDGGAIPEGSNAYIGRYDITTGEILDPLLNTIVFPAYLDYDPVGEDIYWLNQNLQRITRVDVNNPQNIPIVDGRPVLSLAFVPEPGAVTLLGLSSLFLFKRRRR